MLNINDEVLQDIINLELGLFYPINGFMKKETYKSVANNMRLASGEIWTIPISLPVNNPSIKKSQIELFYKNELIAYLENIELFEVTETDIYNIYGTLDKNHPGVKKEFLNKYRVGGTIKLIKKDILNNQLNPISTKNLLKKYNSIVGFQTRNIPHRAHEYLHRLGLEFCDVLFINPLVGWKKKGDFSEEAVEIGYKTLINKYYTNLNVHFETLKVAMRYAGPREAIFHALIRKNLGCTHFIIGRDHAGVGNYYGKYEAQELAKKLQSDLDIKILTFKEPFYCSICNQIVSEKSCGHNEKYRTYISGTKIRNMLKDSVIPLSIYIREEVAKEVIKLKERLFI